MLASAINTSPRFEIPLWIHWFSNIIKILILGGLLWGVANTILAMTWFLRGKKGSKEREKAKKKFKYAIIGYAIVVITWYLALFIGKLIFPEPTSGPFG